MEWLSLIHIWLAWAEQPQTIDEVGSTYTIQGFDLNYAGVILGPSVKYRNGEIIFDPTESCLLYTSTGIMSEKIIAVSAGREITETEFNEFLSKLPEQDVYKRQVLTL